MKKGSRSLPPMVRSPGLNVAGSPHNSNRCEKDMETAARVAAANAAAFFKGEKFGGLIRREDYME